MIRSSILRPRAPRVGLDLHVVDGRYQGSRTHAIEVFGRVIRYCPTVDFYLLSSDPSRLSELHPGFGAANAHPVVMPKMSAPVRLLAQLPWLQWTYKFDLLQCQYILPTPCLNDGVVTIHDILFESHPQYFSRIFNLRSRFLIRRSAIRARFIFTSSQFSKSELVRLYSIHESKIKVLYSAVDHERFHPGTDGADVLKLRGLESGGYILCVGRLEPRKNHSNLLRAYRRLGIQVPTLVFVGQRDFNFEGIFALIREYHLESNVKILEDITDLELPALYRHALCFAYPSFGEGFGIPVVEAIASGTPVLVSNNTSLPEVAGDSALQCDPHDVESIANGLRALLEDSRLRRRLIAAGLNRAQEFNWERSAAVVADVYKEILNVTSTHSETGNRAD